METFLVVYVIVLSIVGGYCCWWLYQAINTITDTLHKLNTSKHGNLLSNLGVIKSAVATSKNELYSSIRSSEKAIKAHVSSETDALRQMIMAQFASQTVKLVEDVEANHRALTNLINTIQSIQNQLNRSIKDNTSKIVELNNSLTYAISDSVSSIDTLFKASMQKLNSEEQKRERTISAGLDTIIRNISNFNNLIEQHLILLEESNDKNITHLDSTIKSLSSSLKLHTDKITSSCNQVFNSEKELHQKTKSSLDLMNENFSRYLSQLKQFDVLYNNLQKLYTRILEEDEKIAKQESSLVNMVSRHARIFELTSEMNNTTKEIFEFMKLYLIKSTIENFKK